MTVVAIEIKILKLIVSVFGPPIVRTRMLYNIRTQLERSVSTLNTVYDSPDYLAQLLLKLGNSYMLPSTYFVYEIFI